MTTLDAFMLGFFIAAVIFLVAGFVFGFHCGYFHGREEK